MTRQESIDAVKDTLKQVGSDFAMGWLAENAPWTQLPFIRTIFSTVFKKFINDLFEEGEYGLFAKYIDLRVNAQGIAVEDAMLANYQAQQNPQLSEDEKNALKAALKEKFAAFAAVNG